MKRLLLLLFVLLALSTAAFADQTSEVLKTSEVSTPRWIGLYHFECRDAAGQLKWQETTHNALANEGQLEMLGVYLTGATAPTAYAIGLSSMTFAKTTTYATITGEPSGGGYARETVNRDGTAAGWPTIALDTGDYKATSKTVTYTATGAIGPVTSAFLVSATNNKLISYTALSASRTLVAGDTLQVTYAVKLQ
jgi:hypothetical protein